MGNGLTGNLMQISGLGYWNTICLMFILLGGFVFCLGIKLPIDYQSEK